MKCLTTVSDGKVWDWNIQNGLEAGRPSLSPEGGREKEKGLPGRYPKLCCNLVLVDASFGGGSRGPSDPVLLHVYLLAKQFYDHIGAARLICRIRHCWKFGTRWPWRCPCWAACASSRIHCRALHVGVQCILSGLCLHCTEEIWIYPACNSAKPVWFPLLPLLLSFPAALAVDQCRKADGFALLWSIKEIHMIVRQRFFLCKPDIESSALCTTHIKRLFCSCL